MTRWNMALPQWDMRCLGLWRRGDASALWVCSGVLGLALLSPGCLHSWQAWEDANAAQAQWMAQQEATQTLQTQTAQLLQTSSQTSALFADTSVLGPLAQQQGLQFSHVGLDKPQHSSAMAALHLQQLPVHWKVQGSWEGWLNWLAQWPTAAPGVTVSSLELKADPRGGISAQVLALAPQSTAADSMFDLPGINLDTSSAADPFSAQAWIGAQRAHAEQHPSYARLVAPELLRPRDSLESFSRDRLQYVGQIASRGAVEALVKVLPPAGTNKDSSMMRVHRVRVGQRLGHDFGKVVAIEPDQLVVQELAWRPSGEWHTREVRLPLHEAAP